MENKVEYEELKFTDWSKHLDLTNEQRNQLIAEKLERARLQSIAMQRSPYKVTQ